MAPLFLDHVVMKTVILIIKVTDSIEVYLQRYTQESSYFKSLIKRLPLKKPGLHCACSNAQRLGILSPKVRTSLTLEDLLFVIYCVFSLIPYSQLGNYVLLNVSKIRVASCTRDS